MTNTFKTIGWRSVAMATALALLIMVTGCAKPKGETGDEKRAYIQNMSAETKARLDETNPGVVKELQGAAGWAVFESVQTQFIITTTGNGFGLAHNNKTGKEYYMSALDLGAGIGLGIKSSKAIMVFETEEVLNKFVTSGWSWGAQGSATAKAVSVEGDAVGDHNFVDGIKVYIMTENGLMAGVSLKGSKVWLDKKLN